MYQLGLDKENNPISVTKYLNDAKDSSIGIPLRSENSMYQQFKTDLQSGIGLQDATGTAMTSAQITTFLATLP